MNQHIGYARVSTDDQNLDLQKDALNKAGCQVIYEEAASGKNSERPELDQCLKALRSGDTLVVWRLDRLGRSLRDLVQIVGDLLQVQVLVVRGYTGVADVLIHGQNHIIDLLMGSLTKTRLLEARKPRFYGCSSNDGTRSTSICCFAGLWGWNWTMRFGMPPCSAITVTGC